MLSGQRHAPHRPLKQLVRTDKCGGREAVARVGGRAAGKGKGWRAALVGGRANRGGGELGVEGSSVEVS